jgi:hypothetical protein
MNVRVVKTVVGMVIIFSDAEPYGIIFMTVCTAFDFPVIIDG